MKCSEVLGLASCHENRYVFKASLEDITISNHRLRWAVDGMRFTAPLFLSAKKETCWSQKRCKVAAQAHDTGFVFENCLQRFPCFYREKRKLVGRKNDAKWLHKRTTLVLFSKTVCKGSNPRVSRGLHTHTHTHTLR